ncbi:Endoplasmic reticulum transmembrane protein [Heracleum sosnowskyi]|uniref:Endoplasmic reticulum transmembrane protein n=1 Tax=Heracleum sosnowskyi TaxID=360622 RepID=A0AAD8M1D9_9APIA|nr:Endoplasmic reticulum transmembrane protein [Heracleum sosnowskyi]
MIQLLYLILFAEGFVALLLMVEISPLRELIMIGLDQVEKRRGTVLTIAGTMVVILISNSYSIAKIQNKSAKVGTMTPMDQVLWRTHLLEASLLGFSLFLGFLIVCMHSHLRELNNLRTTVRDSRQEVERLEKEKLKLKENEEKAKEATKLMQKEVSESIRKLDKLKLESKEKETRVETAEGHVAALQKQMADLLLEYDRLLEDNQNLQAHAVGK